VADAAVGRAAMLRLLRIVQRLSPRASESVGPHVVERVLADQRLGLAAGRAVLAEIDFALAQHDLHLEQPQAVRTNGGGVLEDAVRRSSGIRLAAGEERGDELRRISVMKPLDRPAALAA